MIAAEFVAIVFLCSISAYAERAPVPEDELIRDSELIIEVNVLSRLINRLTAL